MPTKNDVVDKENGWGEFKQLILFRLDQTDSKIDKQISKIEQKIDKQTSKDAVLYKDFTDFKTEIISEIKVINLKLSIKASIAGGLSGVFGAITMMLIYLATN